MAKIIAIALLLLFCVLFAVYVVWAILVLISAIVDMIWEMKEKSK